MPQKTRDLRRHLARSHSKQRKTLHLARVHLNQTPDCACELGELYFSKRRAFGCNCRKRRRGQPRVGTGDKFDARHKIYTQRRAAREVLGAILSGRCLADGEEVHLAFR